jgi:hypothetical protein
MRRPIAILIILAVTFLLQKNVGSTMLAQISDLDLFKEFHLRKEDIANLGIILIGILVGAFYALKYGQFYTLQSEKELDEIKKAPDISLSKFFVLINRILEKAWSYVWPHIQHTRSGRYLKSIYEPPVNSEQVLGSFFFGKTIFTTIIAFYYVSMGPLIGILLFSAIFDSLTGTYQQTLMNYFHKSIFKNRTLIFIQNFIKRFFIDVFRAEVITVFLVGMEIFNLAHQGHVFLNRIVSCTYYFNAVLIDMLVAKEVITRNFRSKFVIFASSFGGLLSLIHLAHTKLPNWIPQDVISSIPSWFPGPLALLGIFNASVFIIAGVSYLIHKNDKTQARLVSIIARIF